MAEKKLSNISGSTLKIINVHMTMYAAASTHNAKSGYFLCGKIMSFGYCVAKSGTAIMLKRRMR